MTRTFRGFAPTVIFEISTLWFSLLSYLYLVSQNGLQAFLGKWKALVEEEFFWYYLPEVSAFSTHGEAFHIGVRGG